MSNAALAGAEEVFVGAKAIKSCLEKEGWPPQKERRIFYMCETGQIPAFRLGGIWHLRRSTLRAHLASLEAAAGR
jgi:hypothetical protein